MSSKIVIADDDKSILELLEIVLNNIGYDVIKATNGRDAWMQIIKHNPILALLDQNMPEMPGIEVTDQLRRQGNDTPIILISADGKSQALQAAMDAGVDAFIEKPFVLHERIPHKIAEVLRKRKLSKVSISVEFTAALSMIDEIVQVMKDKTPCCFCGAEMGHRDGCLYERLEKFHKRFG